MRRKDGQKKVQGIRSKAVFDCGFRELNPSFKNADRSNAHSVVSMFSGCGGLDLGLLGGFNYKGTYFDVNPFRIEAAYDNLNDAVQAYKLNIGDEILETDLSTVDTKQLNPASVLVGGFPCQDFSSSGPKSGLNGKRGQLYLAMRDYLLDHRPKVFLGENVPYLLKLDKGRHIKKIIGDFEQCGYKVKFWELNCPDFGLSQSRKRVIIIGVRNDIAGFPVRPRGDYEKNFLPIEYAIDDLIEVTDETVVNQSQYFVATKATSGGGQGDHSNVRGNLGYCIRANSRGRIQFHYQLDRRLTVRECARLQSFPDEFVFPFSTQRNLTLIGNAVPPIVGHAIAKSLARFLSGEQIDHDSVMPVIQEVLEV